MQCNEWLKQVVRMGKDAHDDWQRAEQEWVNGRRKRNLGIRSAQIILALPRRSRTVWNTQ